MAFCHERMRLKNVNLKFTLQFIYIVSVTLRSLVVAGTLEVHLMNLSDVHVKFDFVQVKQLYKQLYLGNHRYND